MKKETVVLTNTEELESARNEIRRLKEDLNGKEEELRQNARKMDDLNYSKSSLERRLREAEDDLSTKQTELTGLRTTVAEIISSAAGTEAKLSACQTELEKATKKVSFRSRSLLRYSHYVSHFQNSELETLVSEQKEAIRNFQVKTTLIYIIMLDKQFNKFKLFTGNGTIV